MIEAPILIAGGGPVGHSVGFAVDVRPRGGVRRSPSSLLALIVASLVLVGCETGSETLIDLGPIATDPEFPEIGRFEMDFPIQSGDWTIWPDAPQTRAQYRWGHPLELSPFTWDFFAFHSSASEFEIDPHYDKSTWDTFFVDWDGSVRVEAYWGLFKHTFGTQEKLLAGVICFVREVATTLSGSDPSKAMNIEQIAERLESVRKQIAQRPSLPGHEALGFVQGGFGASLSRRFWVWKMGGVPKDILRCRRAGA